MTSDRIVENRDLREMVRGLSDAAGGKLVAVVLYGSAARDDYHSATSDFNLFVVLEDLRPETLASVHTPVARWLQRGQPVPRLFSPQIIADAADVFPVEFLDIAARHEVLFGNDPFAGLEVDTSHLRLQLERELREKLMRLREGYVESCRRPRDLERLMTASYTTFTALFRGCLRLHHEPVPDHNDDVVRAFCERAGLDAGSFRDVDRLKSGGRPTAQPNEIFAAYYEQLVKAVGVIDRFAPTEGES